MLSGKANCLDYIPGIRGANNSCGAAVAQRVPYLAGFVIFLMTFRKQATLKLLFQLFEARDSYSGSFHYRNAGHYKLPFEFSLFRALRHIPLVRAPFHFRNLS